MNKKYGFGPIEFRNHRSDIPIFYATDDGIPKDLIKHGSTSIHSSRKINIVNYYNGYYIVRYLSHLNEYTQLAFEEKDLDPVEGTVPFITSVDNFSII